MKKILLMLMLFSVILSACSSEPKIAEDEKTFRHEFDPAKYTKIVEKWSVKDVYYSGFYNAYEFNATLLNTEMSEARVRFQAQYSSWSSDKLNSELEKTLQELSYDTYVFLSFFTPANKDNNLAKKGSIWTVYLEAGGRRYEGAVIKNTEHPTELMRLYPYHNRWSTPYTIKFRVPVSVVQSAPSKITLSGPLGTAEMAFNKME
ncbi:MAG: hypothetical protein SGJ18_11090 [Pseudomonadota bacterium]|nr:hypothetical protein [Pseudomonadota bacterium]